MSPFLAILCLPLLAAVPAQRLLVMPLQPRVGAPQKTVQALSDFMTAQVRRVPGFQVMSQADVEQLLTMETRRQMLGCDGQNCAAGLGLVLDAGEVLYGNVGRLGETDLVITLTRLDARANTVIAGDAERLSGGKVDAMLDGTARLLHRLYPAFAPPEPRSRPMGALPMFALLSGIGGATMYSTFAGAVLASQLFFLGPPAWLFGLGAFGVCAVSPLYTPVIMAAFADWVGRRQVGIRHAVVASILAYLAVATALPATAYLGFGVGLFALMAMALGFNQLSERQTAQVSFLFLPMSSLVIVSGLLVGTVPTILAVALLVPAVSALALQIPATVRPSDVEPAPPGLYSPTEDPPGWLKVWVPRIILGGKRRALEDEDVPEPAAR